MKTASCVGTDGPRVDGLEKVTGAARYADDLMEAKTHVRDEEIDTETLDELRSLGYIQ